MKSKNSTYRSLGSLNDASNRSIMYGVLIENNTKQKITSLDVAYTGKVWRVGTSTTAIDTLKFEYVVLTQQSILRQLRDRQKFLGEIRARSAAALDFVTPSAMEATVTDPAVKVDGDDDANQTRMSATLNVTVNPGEVVLLRWIDNDEQGDDQALAIDDLVVTATVEAQGVETITGHQSPTTNKYLRNGQVIIRRNNIEYTIFGNRL